MESGRHPFRSLASNDVVVGDEYITSFMFFLVSCCKGINWRFYFNVLRARKISTNVEESAALVVSIVPPSCPCIENHDSSELYITQAMKVMLIADPDRCTRNSSQCLKLMAWFWGRDPKNTKSATAFCVSFFGSLSLHGNHGCLLWFFLQSSYNYAVYKGS